MTTTTATRRNASEAGHGTMVNRSEVQARLNKDYRDSGNQALIALLDAGERFGIMIDEFLANHSAKCRCRLCSRDQRFAGHAEVATAKDDLRALKRILETLLPSLENPTTREPEYYGYKSE